MLVVLELLLRVGRTRHPLPEAAATALLAGQLERFVAHLVPATDPAALQQELLDEHGQHEVAHDHGEEEDAELQAGHALRLGRHRRLEQLEEVAEEGGRVEDEQREEGQVQHDRREQAVVGAQRLAVGRTPAEYQHQNDVLEGRAQEHGVVLVAGHRVADCRAGRGATTSTSTRVRVAAEGAVDK